MAQQKIDGQKAGSGSTRQPEIAPDSASSVTKLKMAVGLSEGEIEGFTRADVKLDGTPLTELSSDIVCDYRFGTNDQEYIPGIDEVANEIGVGVELRGDSDWVKLITNQDIDHVGIRLRWGPLQTSHSNGDITGVSIKYEVHIAAVGGSYERVLSTTLSDKTSDSYERYHEFKLPESDSGWMVRVSRLTPSAQSSLVSDKMYVQAYSEIIKSKFTFPYTSLVYLEYDAKTFSNVAKVAVNAKGLIIKVPSNYDPVTRQYSGLWSGTFKMAYTNNPAWVYYDLVTNPRYGCGDRIDSSMVDKWSLYKLGQYCDQMVDDGYGGLEPRFTCNVYLQNKERAYDILNRLTGLFRAINFWNGSQLVVDADIPQDTSYLYTNANVVDGLFEYAGTAATDLYSAAKVAWDNPANGYNTEYEAVSYEHLVKKLGFKTLELDAWGCTSRGQALRAGRWALLAESDTVTFKVGMDGYLAMPGKIIEIQDEFYAGKSNGGRVISIDQSRTVITLDRPVTTISGDTISFNTALDGIKKYNIVSSSGSVVTVSASIDPSIENMHIWAINSSQLATQKYRILTVKYDGVGEFTISAVEYNPNKYEEIDSNIKFDEPPTSIINPVAQAAVQNVTITPSDFIYQGLNTVNLEIKWDRAENAVEYLVELKKDDGSWLKLPVTGNNSITLENVYAGAYIARVIAVSAFELKSLPTYSIKTTVCGKQSAPLPPINLRSVSIMFGAEFYWDFPPNSSDTAVSRIAVSYVDPAFNVDESDLVIYDKAYSDNKLVIQNLDVGSPVWVKVKLIDKLGFESPYTTWVSGQPSQDVDKVLDLISGHISESTLDQILQGKIDSASNLANDAQNLATQANTAATDALNQATNAITTANTALTEAQAVADDLQANVTSLQAEIDAETTARLAAINTLNDGLTTETTLRQQGDSSLLSNIETYKTSTNTTLSSLQTQINTNATNTSANANAITALDSRVTNAQTTANNAVSSAATAQTTANTAVDLANATSSQTTALRSELSTGNGVNIILAPYSDPQTVPTMVGSLRTVTLVPSPLRRNGKAYNIAFTANTATVYFGSNSVGSAPNGMGAAMTAGAKYMLSLWIKSTSGAIPNLKANVLYFIRDPATGTITKSTSALTPQGTTNTSFAIDTVGRRISFKALTAPANTIGATYFLIGDNAVPAASGEYIVDWLMAEATLGDDKPASTWVAGSADLGVINDSLTANANAISSLTTRVTTAEGGINSNSTAITGLQNSLTTTNNNVALKADQTALNSLSSTVTTQGNTITTQGNSITTLQNNLATTNSNVALKANQSALNTLDSKVTTQGNTITSQGNSITSLQNNISSINGTLATKADSSTVNTLTNRVTAAEGNITALSNQTVSLNNAITLGSSNLIVNSLYADTSNISANGNHSFIIDATQYNRANVLKVTATGAGVDGSHQVYFTVNSTNITSSNPLVLSFYAKAYTALDVKIQLFGGAGSQTISLTTSWQKYTITSLRATQTPNTNLYFSLKSAGVIYLTNMQLEQGNVATSYSPASFNVSDSILATASAVSDLATRVTNAEGTLTSQGSNITSLNNSITTINNTLATKADASALTALTSRVTTAENTLSSQSSSITSLNNSISTINGQVTTINGYITVSDTRSTNQNPQWYWTNHPCKIVREFKQASVLGLNGMGTFVTLETQVPWTDSTGGPVVQIARGTDSKLTAERRSTSTTAWAAWTQDIKSLNDAVLLKADASAVTSLTSTVNNINGRVTANASSITNLNTTVNGHTTSITSNTTSINGVKAVKTVTVDNNGVLSGYGLVSELVNGQVTSSFGVNANNFYIGSPTNNKKPFVVLTSAATINGVTVPAGTYIDTAFIADLTVTTAKINNLAVTNAKIANLAVDNAKIANLSVSTLKIQDNAVTVPVGVTFNNKSCPAGPLYPTNTDYWNQFNEWSNFFGTVGQVVFNKSGGKVRIDASLIFKENVGGALWALEGNNSGVSTTERFNFRMILGIFVGTTCIGHTNAAPVHTFGDGPIVFSGGLALTTILDTTGGTGNITYTLKFGFGYLGNRSTGGKIVATNGTGNFELQDIRMSIMELKK